MIHIFHKRFRLLSLLAALSFCTTGAKATEDFDPPLILTATAAEAAEYLQTFTGQWRGRGVLRESPQRPPAPVVCRAEGSVDPAGALNVGGRCGGEGFTGTFRIAAGYDAASDSYVATWRDPLSGTVRFSGRRSGDQLIFSVPAVAGYPGARLVLSPVSANNFRLRAETTSAGNAPSFVAAEIDLARQ